MSAPVFAENCQICGTEYLSLELIPIRLGGTIFDSMHSCLTCLAKKHDSKDDFKESAQLIIEALKNTLI